MPLVAVAVIVALPTAKPSKKVVKAKAGINPVITPANDLVTKLNYDGKEITSVKVEPANKKLGIPAETVKAFTVHQSDFLGDCCLILIVAVFAPSLTVTILDFKMISSRIRLPV